MAWSLLLLIVCMFLVPAHSEQGVTCQNDNLPRQDCGFVGVTQQQCTDKGCCWHQRDGQPWCFTKTSESDPQATCQNDNFPRNDCGFVGVTQQQCTDKGCCWNQRDGQPWCFTKTSESDPQATCQNDNFPRKECGFFGITEQQCIDTGCCWNPKDNQPWCFSKIVPPPPTPTCLPDQPRLDCGYVGIDQGQCEQSGCCWNPADNLPWCFQKTGGTLPAQCKVDGPRFDCGSVGTTEQTCIVQSCCWSPAETGPYCFYQTPVYTVESISPSTLGLQMKLVTKSPTSVPYGPNISPLTFELWQESKDRLHFKFTDPSNKRWEVPESVLPTPPPPSSPPSATSYTYQVPKVGEEFFISIKRGDNQETIFNTTSIGTLQFGNQYLSIGTHLPVGHYIYGIGERKAHFRLTPGGSNCGNTYPLWNADIPTIPENFNLYGSHPFYLDLRKNGLAHGVFLKNSNGMDVEVGQTSLQYKVIGGVLDFYVFLGPSPEEVIQQYQEVIGRPQIPLYWTLGFHQCRYGYEHLQDLKDVINGYANSKIPLDVIWSDIDYMDDYKDFTLDPSRFPASEVKQFISDVHSKGIKYVMIIDPGIGIDKGYPAYDRGIEQDVFFKDFNGNNYVGKVWPGDVHYPDFFHPKAQSYWETEFRDFFNNLANVDGIWLDMNECANFCDGVCSTEPQSGEVKRDGYSFNPNDPPYYINNRCSHSPLFTRTVAVDAEHHGGVLEYDAHNLYGIMESIATKKALEAIRPNKRQFVLSRANFPGSGVHSVHWNGDNTAHDTDLYFSIPMMLSFQLFGIPFVGSDICGFFEDTTEELCGRWMQIGSFYPFARNHNFKGPIGQEPYRWESVAHISRKYLGIRYSLLPYYYTLFYKAHRPVDQSNAPSATVIRPLFFEFPQDENTYPIDWQFMLGTSLLISPVLRVGDAGKSVSVYFPSGSRWYDWYTHQITSSKGGENKNIDTAYDYMPIHIQGGVVIPMQDPALTTEASRANLFYLLVALSETGVAKGDVFIDDGESDPVGSHTFVDYSASGNRLIATPSGTGYASNMPPLDRVVVIGLTSVPTVVTKDSVNVPFSYDNSTRTLTVGPGLKTSMDTQYVINWNNNQAKTEL